MIIYYQIRETQDALGDGFLDLFGMVTLISDQLRQNSEQNNLL